jgi:Ca2+/Na+ antiporter
MFSPGQKIFALVFIASFIAIITIQFIKDKKKNPQLFKKSYWIVLAVIATMVGFVLFNKLVN